MKFIHLADLHLGKTVNEFLMIEDQIYILQEIIKIIKTQKVDMVIISGDIYDRSIPPTEAVELLNHFLTQMVEMNLKVVIIPGNHDSAERIAFANSLLRKNNVYISAPFQGDIEWVEFQDEYGLLRVYLLPFVKPAAVRHFYKDDTIDTYEDAVLAMVNHIEIDKNIRNIISTHHFVTNIKQPVELSDSENRLSVGGSDNVDYKLFDSFDYVALGHIHGPQKVGRNEVRYAGSPLKYSFSEEFHHKSVPIVTMNEKGSVDIELKELIPLKDMRRIKGKLADLMKEEIINAANPNDYIGVILTDDQEFIDPIGTLRMVYPNIMQLTFEKNENKTAEHVFDTATMKEKTPLQLISGFFEYAADREFDEERHQMIIELLEEAQGRMSV